MTDLDPSIARTIAQTCIAHHIRRANRALIQVFDEVLEPFGLRSGQFTILTALAFAGPVPMTRLADALGMDRTTLTRNLEPLVENGFVIVGAGKDRRRRLVSILPTGNEALAAAYPVWKDIQERLVGGVGDADRLRADLVRIDQIADEMTTVGPMA